MYSRILSKASLLLSSHDVSQYADYVRGIPRLSLEDELDCARKYRDFADREAYGALLCSALWLGVVAAKKFKFVGDHQADIIQEANLALVKALANFDTQAGVRFSTYATLHVKAQVHNYMIDNWRMVKVATTKAKRKVFHNLHRFISVGEKVTEAKIACIAEHLGVSVADVKSVQAHMLAEARMGVPTGQDGLCIEDQLSCDLHDPERSELEIAQLVENKALVARAMGALNEREHDVISSRVLPEKAVVLEVLSDKYQVSRERIRQIEVLALKKMKAHLMAA